MEIRHDFEDGAPYLHRLHGLGETFRKFARDDWSHYRNQEDFEKVFRLENSLQLLFENLYADGRDMAYYLSHHLRAFNSIAEYPSMTSYVQSFERGWYKQIDKHKERLESLAGHLTSDTPWSVRQMIDLWSQQIDLLETVVQTVEILKQTNIYRIEKGELKLSDIKNPNFTVGVMHGGKINVGSIDNSDNSDHSTNINITNHIVFDQIKDTINKSSIPTQEKDALLRNVDEMASNVGKPSFAKSYREFIGTVADHISLIGPYIPALTALLI